MTLEQMVSALVSWFGGVGGASLKLPNGWFGRPFDNLHRLTAAQVDGNEMVLVLDDMQRMSISTPASIRVEPKSASLIGASRVEWRWVEYGTSAAHVEVFEGGDVEFHVS